MSESSQDVTASTPETLSLAGKIILVTGAGRGIGLATSQLARHLGARVAACDLSFPHSCVEKDSATERGITGNAGKILQMRVDISQEADCKRVVEETINRFGRIDVLVNNAGILEPSLPTVQQQLSDWRKVIDVNLQGTFLMARDVAAQMIAQKIAGSIINISSVVGHAGFRAQNAYGASKAAVEMLTKTLSADLARHRIRVNAVAPGFINTNMTTKLGDSTKVNRQAFIERIPQGRFGEPEEIARAILFLASNWASYITGTTLSVDGGWSAFGGPSEPPLSAS